MPTLLRFTADMKQFHDERNIFTFKRHLIFIGLHLFMWKEREIKCRVSFTSVNPKYDTFCGTPMMRAVCLPSTSENMQQW